MEKETKKQEMARVMPQVHKILMDYPATKDSDKLLTLAVLVIFYELKENIDTYEDLKAWLLTSKVPAFSTITRNRQKLQEHLPETRGPGWAKRRGKRGLVKEFIQEVDVNDLDADDYDDELSNSI